MSASFNVLDQGWIPVINNNGTKELLGIRQTIARAHELKEISDPSPLEEFSVYRFLGLFLMDALRPEDDAELEEILDAGSFDTAIIEKYILDCKSEGTSFDLFDSESPFLQTTHKKDSNDKFKPISVLDCTLPSGNNHVHFNHYSANTICPEKAIRLILVSYWFCTACAQEYPTGVYGAPPFFGVIKGRNLFETLTYLLLPVDNLSDFDFEPVLWRRKSQVEAKKKVGKTSWLHGMLFPTRRICLNLDDFDNITGVYFSQGENFVNKDSWSDPYVTYIDGKDRKVPLCPDGKVPVWHNIYSIIDIQGKHASMLINQYKKNPEHTTADLTLYGVETDQAKYLAVYRCDFLLPLKLSEQWIIVLLKAYVNASQQFRITLVKAIKNINDIPDSAAYLAVSDFDKNSENSFKDLCRTLETSDVNAQNLLNSYLSLMFDHARNAYNNVLKTLNLRAHALAEASKNLKMLYNTRKKLTN